MSYSKGVSWIGDCRIPFVDEADGYSDEEWKNLYAGNRTDSPTNVGNEVKNIIRELLPKAPKGRFTPNLLVCDDMLNDGRIGGSSYCPPTKYEYENSKDKFNSGGRRTKTGIGDKGTNSRYYSLDLWFDKMLEKL